MVRVKQFIAQLLEPEPLSLEGDLVQLEVEVADGGLQDSPVNDSGQLEWPESHDEEEELGLKGGNYQETKQLEADQPSHDVYIEDEERHVVQNVETSHSSLLKVEKAEISFNAAKERKLIDLDNDDEMEKLADEHKGRAGKCDCKDLTFSDKKSQVFHISTVHSNMDGCQVCRRVFSSSENFKEHMRSHHGRSCECQNILDMDEKQVLFHNQTVHRKHFGCDICFRTFRKRAHGLVHMAEHNGERGFQCDQCGNDYKRAGDLKSHTKLCLDLDPVKCDLCEKYFKGKQRLKLHRRRFHVDLHQCPDCPKQVLFVPKIDKFSRF